MSQPLSDNPYQTPLAQPLITADVPTGRLGPLALLGAIRPLVASHPKYWRPVFGLMLLGAVPSFFADQVLLMLVVAPFAWASYLGIASATISGVASWVRTGRSDASLSELVSTAFRILWVYLKLMVLTLAPAVLLVLVLAFPLAIAQVSPDIVSVGIGVLMAVSVMTFMVSFVPCLYLELTERWGVRAAAREALRVVLRQPLHAGLLLLGLLLTTGASVFATYGLEYFGVPYPFAFRLALSALALVISTLTLFYGALLVPNERGFQRESSGWPAP